MTNLCDPAVANDEATEDMCLIDLEDRVIKRFMDTFGTGKIVGNVEYEYEFARVLVQEIGQSEKIHTFTLVKRYGNWFLFRFQ